MQLGASNVERFIEVVPTGVPSGVAAKPIIGLSLELVARQAVTVTLAYNGLTNMYKLDKAVQGEALAKVDESMVKKLYPAVVPLVTDAPEKRKTARSCRRC